MLKYQCRNCLAEMDAPIWNEPSNSSGFIGCGIIVLALITCGLAILLLPFAFAKGNRVAICPRCGSNEIVTYDKQGEN